MRFLMVTLVVIASAAFSHADDNYYLGSSLGLMIWDDERFGNGEDNSANLLGLHIGHTLFNETAAMEISASQELGDTEYELYQFALINYLNDDPDMVRPYWLVGLAATDSGSSVDVDYVVNDTLSGVLGFGISGFVNEQVELRGDARAFYSFDSDPSISGLRDYALTLGVNYHFGRESSSAPAPAPKPAAAPEPVRQAAPAPAPAAPAEMRTITIRLNVEFANNSDDVAAVYGDEIQEVANAMASQTDLELVLEGHTDSSGAEEYNQGLSQRRVEAVKATLVDQYGIDGSRVTAVGYGESRPIADNSTDEGRARNRRVVGVISWDEVAE